MKELAPGTAFGPWRIERMIGRGGMGVVYLATDTHLNRPVAIKLIGDERAEDPAFRERFEREARLTAAIDHPNVIPVYAAGEEDGQLYLATRFVAGTDLQDLLWADGPLAPQRAADIVRQVGDALDAAHAAGLVHRDVKPANVLLSGQHAYLSDFGLTRSVEAEARLTDTDERLGTVDFMAPEQLRGQRTDARSDVYALGCLLHAVLTGEPPFRRASAAATITAHLEAPVPRPSAHHGVDPAFDSVVARALAKDPDERYPSAGDLGRAAVAAARGQATVDLGHSVARGDAAPADAGADAEARTRRIGSRPSGRGRGGAAETGPTAHIALKENKRRNLMVEGIVIAGLFAVALVVTAIALTPDGDDPNRPLSHDDVSRVTQSFARAYTREDATTLGRILSPDVQRVSAADVQRGRPAVLAAYRSQFRSQVTREYRLDDLAIEAGDVGRATGRFTVTREGRPPITGQVVLGVERRRGRVRIRLIATESRS